MSLARYHAKRDFTKTPEPAGRAARKAGRLRFVIQKHAASRLHYDFRLELDGTLKSWAVPKGPSLDPADKRLAVHVEDHPVEYGSFEGVIPEKQYGAGQVIVWDQGTWAPLAGDARKAYREGHLKFELEGEKMHGAWALVRMHGRNGDDHDNWLLIKEKDDQAEPGQGEKLVKERPESVISGRSVEELKGQGREDVWDSNQSDPAKAFKPAAGKAKAGKAKAGKGVGAKSAKATNATRATKATKATKAAAPREPTKAKRIKAFVDGEAVSASIANLGSKAAQPASMEPQLATLAEQAPQDEGWAYEVKFDGYRLVARIKQGKVSLITRNGHDWSAKFPRIVAALEALGMQSAWLDGEVCVMNDKGVSSFGLLQQWLSNEGEGARRDACYMLFDMPYCAGRDLREVPLSGRKAALADVLADVEEGGVLRLSQHLDDASGEDAQLQACKLGLEGLIGKRVDGHYINGRSRDWIKLKCRQRQEFVIGGFTPPQGSRSHFGSLLLGVHDKGGKLRYAGRVGTGFDGATLQSVFKRLETVEAEASPFSAPLPAAQRARGTRWVKPRLVAEVTFAEWTSDGLVRQGAFEGLREDKPARVITQELPVAAKELKGTGAKKSKVSTGSAASKNSMSEVKDAAAPKKAAVKSSAKESPKRTTKMSQTAVATKRAAVKKAPAKTGAAKEMAGAETVPKTVAKAGVAKASPVKAGSVKPKGHEVAGVVISHPDRVVYPADGVTKLEVAQFYERVAERLLPFIKDRPLSLMRCPGGIDGQCFFQKHAKEMHLPGVEAPLIEDTHGENPYIVVRDVQGLVGLAQWGNLELHAWNATMRNIEKPDMIVIDFDPADDVPWSEVADAARAARTLFDHLGLTSFVKTTGGKGLHVVVPFTPKDGWDVIKEFSHQIALRLVEAFPDRFLATATIAKRKGKIFVDYLRNGRGATAVTPYTLRARPGATVAVPLSWDDLDRDWRAQPVRLRDVMAARGKQADPWKDYFKPKQSITEKMKRAVGMV